MRGSVLTKSMTMAVGQRLPSVSLRALATLNTSCPPRPSALPLPPQQPPAVTEPLPFIPLLHKKCTCTWSTSPADQQRTTINAHHRHFVKK